MNLYRQDQTSMLFESFAIRVASDPNCDTINNMAEFTVQNLVPDLINRLNNIGKFAIDILMNW